MVLTAGPCWGCAGAKTGLAPGTLDDTQHLVDAKPIAPQPRPWVSPHSYASYVRGQVLAARGDHGAAVQAFETAIDDSGPDPWVESQLALSLAELGHHDRALERLDGAIGRTSGATGPYPALLTSRGAVHERRGDRERALQDYSLAARLDRRGDAVAPLARLLERLDQPERAIAVLEQAAAAHPRHGIAAARLRLQLALAGRDSVATHAALASLRALRALSRSEATAIATGALADDRPWLATRVLAQSGLDSSTAPLLVAAQLAAGDLDAARAVLDRVPPEDLGGPLPAARAWLQVGAPERALELADHALAIAGGEAPLPRERAQLVRAEALLGLEQPVKALQAAASVGHRSPLAADATRLGRAALSQAGLPATARAWFAPASRPRGETRSRDRSVFAE